MGFDDVKPNKKMTRGGSGYREELMDLMDQHDEPASEPARGGVDYYQKLDKEREEVRKNAPPRQAR